MSSFGTYGTWSSFRVQLITDYRYASHISEWDLWGPLVICLALAIILSIDVSHLSVSHQHLVVKQHLCPLQSPADQSIQVFSMVISLVTVGSVIVTVNAKLLGGRVSFFQSLVSRLLQTLMQHTC
jgi:hypothetical protein